MKTEVQCIKNISKHLPRSPLQINQLFESDSEILKSRDGFILYSIDDYSDEDHFRTTNPFVLGRNVAIASISDIYASGGQPEYYMHSVVLNSQEWNDSFIDEFFSGVGSVLQEADVFFIGGDLGAAHSWHYTAMVSGNSKRVLTRKGTRIGETILMTGMAGVGNSEAAISLNNLGNEFPSLGFNLRKKEALLISKYATTCIDTSDGVVNSLNCISTINDTGYNISSYEYHPIAKKVTNTLGIPGELLLLGECGEYELLFTIDTNKLSEFFSEAEKMNLQFTTIGKISDSNQRILQTDKNGEFNLLDFNIRGRDFSIAQEYIASLIKYLNKHGNN